MPQHLIHTNLDETPWAKPAGEIPLPNTGEIHIYRLQIKCGTDRLLSDRSLLNAAELERAGRFHYEKDRQTYVRTRATLRRLLGRYLNVAPASLSFKYSEYGKPLLPSGSRAGNISFNVSHSGGYALLAFTREADIGVDLELMDPTIDTTELTKRFFSQTERDQLLRLPAAEQIPAFYRTWTRKEAFLKAHGVGLSLPLDAFAVTIELELPTRLERIDWATGTSCDWSLASFMVAAKLPGAVVVNGRINSLRLFDWR